MAPLPPEILLLSLSTLLAHPPTHKHHTRSLFVAQLALRKCLSLPGLDSNTECRAWTELAEVGLRTGLNEPGVESEVERAITKALVIAKKHPSLRVYKTQLTHLSSKLALHKNNPRFAQNALKKHLTNSVLPSDPPHVQYSAHLAYITSLSTIPDTDHHSASSGHLWVLTAIREFHQLAADNGHLQVALLATVLELRELVQAGLWSKVGLSLTSIEEQLSISSDLEPAAPSAPVPSAFKLAEKPKLLGGTDLEKVLIVQALMIGVIYHTYTGDNANAQSRMKKLHDLLDNGALDAFGKFGVVELDLGGGTPLLIQVTHPKVIFGLGFLVSAVAKRDPVGRKPKRRVFAGEGVALVDREVKKEVPLPLWASSADVHEIQLRMQKMKADMLCELIGVAITRSEFDDAERSLAQIIAHTRTYGLFSAYSARITLHQAHLAHALAQTDRAWKCYQVAAFLSRKRTPSTSTALTANTTHPSRSTPNANANNEDEDDGCEDDWVNVSARAGDMWLRIGVLSAIEDEEEREEALEVLRIPGMEIAKECEGLGGTLKTVGAVLTACLAKEFLVTKTHLRAALQLTSAAGDNHMRALILSLIAEQYLHTSTEHAETILNTAEQIAAGLGAQPKPTNDAPGAKGKAKESPGTAESKATQANGVGNAYLRLWIGQRSLELKRRAGDEKGVAKQIVMNEKLSQEVKALEKRKLGQIPSPKITTTCLVTDARQWQSNRGPSLFPTPTFIPPFSQAQYLYVLKRIQGYFTVIFSQNPIMLACRSCGVEDCLDLRDVPVGQCKLRKGSKCGSCFAIELLDAEIEAAKETLACLFKKHFTLKAERNHEHDSFSRLPPEIISRVFVSCRPEEPYISRSTPQLWTYVNINIDDPASLESNGFQNG
ncbi:unnamed protein product [Cyclocybe aegerita]|uniref:Uncharacterized protein n=1 Tax=Cyclocybe aegerita TaxID=1973307 RepID=A0A8S0WRF7_CYCAE|nr:unnamed protein product [Cyclocybe aegerita]